MRKLLLVGCSALTLLTASPSAAELLIPAHNGGLMHADMVEIPSAVSGLTMAVGPDGTPTFTITETGEVTAVAEESDIALALPNHGCGSKPIVVRL